MQTILLCILSVFQYTLAAFYAIVLLGAAFLSIAVLQAFARPLAKGGRDELHYIQLCGNACLFLTAYCSLNLFPLLDSPAANDAASTVVTWALVACNSLYVACILAYIVYASTPQIRTTIGFVWRVATVATTVVGRACKRTYALITQCGMAVVSSMAASCCCGSCTHPRQSHAASWLVPCVKHSTGVSDAASSAGSMHSTHPTLTV